MVAGVAEIGLLATSLALAALEVFAYLNLQCGAGTTTSAEAPLLDSAAEVLLPLAAAAVLFVAVALTYRHLMSRHHVAAPMAGAGNGRRSVSGAGLVIFALCLSAGTLEYVVFGQAAAGGGADHGGAQARALALAALHALPAAATGTFFGGVMLIIIACCGEDGGTGAFAGDGPIQGLLLLLTKVTGGMAAALVGLMVMALTLYGAKY